MKRFWISGFLLLFVILPIFFWLFSASSFRAQLSKSTKHLQSAQIPAAGERIKTTASSVSSTQEIEADEANEAPHDRSNPKTTLSKAKQLAKKRAPRRRGNPLAPRRADFFAGVDVLEKHRRAGNEPGQFIEERLIRADFKYPLLKVTETVGVNQSSGEQEVLKRVAVVADHVAVQVHPSVSHADVQQLSKQYGFSIRRKLKLPGGYLIALPNASLNSVTEAIALLQQEQELVDLVEPDAVINLQLTPDDEKFSQLWGLHNIGQSSGSNDADIDALEAWDISTGSKDVVVGVIDTGVDYTHPDLKDNIWVNPGEREGDANRDGFPGEQGVDDDGDGLIDEDFNGCSRDGVDLNGNSCTWSGADFDGCQEDGTDENGEPCRYKNDLAFDDDENGFPDDILGWDFYSGTNDPVDDNLHGTHVAGTIGATGNNTRGVVGVNWIVSIVPLKIFNWQGRTTESAAAEAIEYSTSIGAHLTSNSWGGGFPNAFIGRAIMRADEKGILFVAAAGNGGVDTEESVANAHYPSGYLFPNIISVAATDRNDDLAEFSNYGFLSVHLGAPGVDILSTFPSYRTFEIEFSGLGTDYGSISGTSMATPHVSGAAALLMSVYPELSHHEIRQRLLDSVKPLSVLEGKTVTGGRLDLANALGLGPRRVFMKQFEIDDSSSSGVGEQDGFLNPGETVALSVMLRNYSYFPVRDVQAKLELSTPDPAVSIIQADADYGDFTLREESLGSTPFVIQVSADVPTPYRIPLKIRMRDVSGETHFSFLTLYAYRNYPISGRVLLDGAPFPGVPVTFSGVETTSVTSDSQGEYRGFVLDGDYEVNFAPNDFNVVTKSVVGAENIEPVNADYRTHLYGKIVDITDEKRVRGATLRFWGDVQGEITAGDDGDFAVVLPKANPTPVLTVYAAKPGEYFPSQTVTLPPTARPEELNIQLHPGGYTIRQITFPDNYLSPLVDDINNAGQVVGDVFVQEGSEEGDILSYLWQDGSLELITPNAWAVRINESGAVTGGTGSEQSDGSWLLQPYRYRNGSVETFAPLPGHTRASARAINNRGEIAGYSRAERHNSTDFPVIWNAAGQPRELDLLERATDGEVYAINDDSLAAGVSRVNLETEELSMARHATIWDANGALDLTQILPVSDLAVSEAVAVNNSGEVLGWFRDPLSPTPGGRSDTPFLFKDGDVRFIDFLDHPADWNSAYADDVNESGVAVGGGYIYGPDYSGYHAFLWNESYGSIRLSDTVEPGSEWTRLVHAIALNDYGAIIGAGFLGSEPGVPYILEPTRSLRAPTLYYRVASCSSRQVQLQVSGTLSSQLFHRILVPPKNGSISSFDAKTGLATYTPDSDFHGVDEFSFAVREGPLTSNPGRVKLYVGIFPNTPSQCDTPQKNLIE